MRYYDFNINGIELIKEKGFPSLDNMITWTINVLKKSTKDKIDTVIVSQAVIDKITTSHFIKYKFISKYGEDGKVTVTYCEI